MWTIDLTGKTALVTGASLGIGRAIALGLAEAGADVIGLARTEQALHELGREIRGLDRRFLPLVADLAEVERIPEAANVAWEWHGAVDILVNAAGMMIRSDTLAVKPHEWDQLYALNVRAPFFLTQAIGARMLEANGGAVVNICSLAGEVATGASVLYCSSKAALIQMTRVLAAYWAPKVRVNAVGPGYIRTGMNARWLEDPENVRFVLNRTPLGRIGEPGDVVGAAIFLASPAASYITGHHLLVDGGWYAQ
ncbi:MAG: SDR family NAD(P)-dependent oxidoreductase [Dehalococcoidia bacterium]